MEINHYWKDYTLFKTLSIAKVYKYCVLFEALDFNVNVTHEHRQNKLIIINGFLKKLQILHKRGRKRERERERERERATERERKSEVQWGREREGEGLKSCHFEMFESISILEVWGKSIYRLWSNCCI